MRPSHFSCVRLFATPWTVVRQGSSVHNILQAKILEWVAISFSRDLGIEPKFPELQVDSLPSELSGKHIIWKDILSVNYGL